MFAIATIRGVSAPDAGGGTTWSLFFKASRFSLQTSNLRFERIDERGLAKKKNVDSVLEDTTEHTTGDLTDTADRMNVL